MKRLFASFAFTVAITGLTPTTPLEARRPIHWKIGEYQTTQFDAQPGDTVSVFFHSRDTETNLQKCYDMGGQGLILVRWRNRVWETCPGVDF